MAKQTEQEQPFDYKAFVASLPKKRMAAGAIIRDEKQRILMLQPGYKPNWEIPGGIVEENESPLTACKRELEEELGMKLPLERLLSIDYNSANDVETESLHFIFDAGLMTQVQKERIQIDGEEIIGYDFLALEEIEAKASERLFRRIQRCVSAIENGGTYYLENQDLV